MWRSVMVLAIAAASMAACGASSADDADFVEVPGLGVTRIDVPRPTTPGVGECTLALAPDASIQDRVHALRSAGLFDDRADVTDAALAAQVEQSIAAAWGDIRQDPLFELYVAEQDATRVWWRDLEADVGEGGEVYRSVLADWAAISVGAFAPSAVEETWGSPSGPVTVGFEHGGTPQTIEPRYIDDWIDPGIAVPINNLIASSGRRFELVKAFDQTAFVMALTPDERAALEARGWCFE